MAKNQTLDEYARVGATARIAELQTEIAALTKMFPGLDEGAGSAPAASALAALMDPPPKRKRSRMSAAGRKAISDAQKKRWAKRKGNAQK